MSVSINIGNDNYYPFKIVPPPRQSLTRKWQRLTRLQKSIAYVITFAVVLLLIYKTTNHDIPSNPPPTHERKTPPPTRPGNWKKDSADDTAKEEVTNKILDSNELELQDKDDNVAREIDGSIKDDPPKGIADTNEDDDGHDDAGSDGRGLFEGPTNQRQNAVVSAVKHSWSAYKRYAWGKDQLKPLSKTSHTWFDLGLTIIDSLDTLYIMGLTDEFNDAKDWVEHSLSFEKGDVNLFETTIRVLGGLLSTYHLSGNEIFLEKARVLGDRLMPAFKTSSGVPFSDVNIKLGTSHAPRWGPDSSTSEVTTIQLEFNELSYITGDDKYKEAVANVRRIVHQQQKKDGLIPIFINAQTGKFRDTATISVGARGDSYYEYLLKEWIQTGKQHDSLREDYIEAISGISRHLLKKSQPNGLPFIGELLSGRKFSPKMDHLVAFISGTLALGAHHGMPREHLQLGKDLLVTFYQMYAQMPAGLSPEIAYFSMADNSKEDIIVKKADAHNLLRPETVESLYYLYWLTGDKKYQDWGWEIFQAFEKHAKISNGYCSLDNVKLTQPSCRDDMESFWLGETLKYFYLLFADKNLLPFDKWVINTEAHPLPIHKH